MQVTRGMTAPQDSLETVVAATAGSPRGRRAPWLPGVALARTRSRFGALPLICVWFFRSLLVVPFVLMAPEVISLVLGRAGSVANVSASTADVLGTSSFLLFVMMLAVTP